MPADLDAELEEATRRAFARMIGAIEVSLPEQVPDASTAVPRALDRHDDRHLARRRRNLWLTAAAVGAAAAAIVAVVVLPDRSDSNQVSTSTPSSTTPPSSTPPTTASSTTATTADPDEGTGPDDTGGAGTGTEQWPGAGEVRPAELRGLLDQPSSDVPLERLDGVVDLRSATLPVTLSVADDGNEIAAQLSVPGQPDYGSGIEGTPRHLQTHWMVSPIDNQFVVWGIVPSEIASVTVYTTDGEIVTGTTVPAGSPAMQSAAFAVILPELAYIEALSGERAGGSVSLQGVELEASLAQFQQHSPLLREWTGFIPMVQH